MIKTWTLENFKSFAQETTLDFAPLTIICGANSAGKSSILHSILGLSQSVGERAARGPFVFNGPRVRLGDFTKLAHGNSTEIGLGIEFEAHYQDIPGLAATQAGWPPLSLQGSRAITAALRVRLTRGPVGARSGATRIGRLSFHAKGVGPDFINLDAWPRTVGNRPAEPMASSFSVPSILGNLEYVVRLEAAGEFEEALSPRLFGRGDATVAGIQTQGLLPTSLWLKYDPLVLSLERVIAAGLVGGGSGPTTSIAISEVNRLNGTEAGRELLRFFQSPTVATRLGRSPSTLDELPSLLGDVPASVRADLFIQFAVFVDDVSRRPSRTSAYRTRPLPATLLGASSSLQRMLGDLKHIGPLREAPRPSTIFPEAMLGTSEFGENIRPRFFTTRRTTGCPLCGTVPYCRSRLAVL